MVNHKYIDPDACTEVIGCVYQDISLLDNQKYSFTEEDFPNEFHRVLFGALYELHRIGVKEFDISSIEDFLENKTKSYGIYKNANGTEFLQTIREVINPSTFDFYYQRMKKMTLLRMYNERAGMDLSWLYDVDNITDLRKKEKQEDRFNKLSIYELGQLINGKIEKVKNKFLSDVQSSVIMAGEGIDDTLDMLRQSPAFGVPMYGNLFNTVYQGARLTKFYLRSANSGGGKSRRFIADACSLAATELYDPNLKTWVPGNVQTSVGYITTEQTYDEIQTMMLSFISCVNEDKILHNSWTPEEYERIKYAAQVLKKSKIYIKILPDFTLQDIEDTIRYFKSEYDISYVIHDYIHSSMKILGEVSGKAGVKGLREDNVLFMISVKLKDLANELGIFILSGTQINNEYHYTKTIDESVLSGAKSIAFKVDIGEVDVPVTEEDRGLIKTIVDKIGCDMPDLKCSIYKNRRGKWTRIYIWCKKDLGVCRVYPLFCTNWYYELLDIGGTQIKVK